MEARRAIDPATARRSAQRAAEILAGDARVQLVYLFGSAARPDARRARDVDLAVLTDQPLASDELLKRRAEVVAATGASVDLVSLNDASIALRHEVVEAGVCLYARNPEIETEFVTHTRTRYWDFKPYLDEQWRLAGERLAGRRGGP